jgi:hypothetical protein
MTKKPTHVKDYLKAKSPENLKILMLKNSIKMGMYHDYIITHDGSNWFAWFEIDAESMLEKEFKRLSDEELNSRSKV